MRTPPRPEDRRRATALGLVALVATMLVTVAPVRGAGDAVVSGAVAAWRGAFGARPQAAAPSKRMIVVLAAPSVADQAAGLVGPRRPPKRVAGPRRRREHSGSCSRSSPSAGSTWSLSYSFTRTVNGFSAALDDRALAELERIGGVAGVYPVRTVIRPDRHREIGQPEFSEHAGRRPSVQLPGFDGAGVTVALSTQASSAAFGTAPPGTCGLRRPAWYRAGRRPFDARRARAAGDTRNPHGRHRGRWEARGGRRTGCKNPAAPHSRLAPHPGWLLCRSGRGDALVAGLERAVDPDGNGDLRDAADIALAAVVEPFAAFSDSPESRAVAGATRLGRGRGAAGTMAGQDGKDLEASAAPGERPTR